MLWLPDQERALHAESRDLSDVASHLAVNHTSVSGIFMFVWTKGLTVGGKTKQNQK